MLVHALPGRAEVVLHAALRNQVNGQRVIKTLSCAPHSGELVLESPIGLSRVTLHSPDLADLRPGKALGAKTWSVDMASVSRYFVLECVVA